MTTATKYSTFDKLKEAAPEVFKKINYACGLTSYVSCKVRNDFISYDFNCSINAWRFDTFITDAQWKTIAQLCIRFNANISEVLRNLVFETKNVIVQDFSQEIQYFYPTNVKGFIGDIYFLIEEDGRAHS